MDIWSMNKLPARVSQIEGEQNLHIVSFEGDGYSLKMMGLDLPQGLEVNAHVLLGVKSSHVAIAKNLTGKLSYSNQINAVVETIEEGKLLCNVLLRVNDFVVQSIITTSSARRLSLGVGDEVVLLMKASELFVLEVVHA